MVTPVQEIHVVDTNLAFIATVRDFDSPLDISTATSVEIHFQKPDGTTLYVQGAFVTDGTDGQIQYITDADDFDQSGTWRYQVVVAVGPSIKYSNIAKFKIFPNIPLEI